MNVPILPESAPFSPPQRAWLNGFFAGVFGASPTGVAAMGGMVPALLSPAAAAPGMTLAPVPTVEEDFPWHDPTLPIVERLSLAEGKPVERKLMAAMAQLDCGACGYLCRTYSEAIARGEEKDLTRCTPGGKDTSRKLKELMNGAKPAATNGKPASSNVGASTSSGPTRQKPALAKVRAIHTLNACGSAKDTRQVVFDLSDTGVVYDPGDSLGVFPRNCPELVGEILSALNLTGEEPSGLTNGRPHSMREALLEDRTITRVSEALAEACAASARDMADAARLRTLVAENDGAWLETADLLDLLQVCPCDLSPATLIEQLTPIAPRLYSISSSLAACPGEVHLTVGVVRYDQHARKRKGVCSTYLADRLQPGDTVRVFPQASHGFRLPSDPSVPVIMVGPGTGVAPFRAFLQERKARGATGKNWLFFGDQCQATDFLYRDELEQHLASGLLTRLETAFSRDQQRKIYVQDRLREQGSEIWAWLESGAHFYVCGDAKRMAGDVDSALQAIVASEGKKSPEEAKAYVQQLTKSKRYLRDVY